MFAIYVERLWKEKESKKKGCDRLRWELNEELNLQSYHHLSNEVQTVLFYNQN